MAYQLGRGLWLTSTRINTYTGIRFLSTVKQSADHREQALRQFLHDVNYAETEIIFSGNSYPHQHVWERLKGSRDLDKTAKPTYRWLKEGPLSLSQEQANRFVRIAPRVLHQLSSTLADNLEGLTSTYGHEEAIKMVLLQPYILGIGTTAQKARLKELSTLVGEENAMKMIKMAPCLLGYALEPMKSVLQYLEKVLVMSRKEAVACVVKLPTMFGYSIAKNLAPKIEYLEKVLEMSRKEAVACVVKLPHLFGYSIAKNLAPKIEYLKTELKATPEDIKETTYVLCYSLDKRIKPRADAMRAAGLTPTYAEDRKRLTYWNDESFNKWLQKSIGAKTTPRSRP